MSTPSENIHTSPAITGFYTQHLNDFGNSAKGVGWKNDQAQVIRFEQLAKVIPDADHFTINDLGCGTGQFYKFLIERNYRPSLYNGYDILDEMISAARKNLPAGKETVLKKIHSAADMEVADYSVASGIFNVKYSARESEWLHNVLSTLDHMNEKSTKGFSFNLLTKYSDKEYMQDYLYYADPLFIFDYCKRNFSKNIALLHDYEQYDFTILVRKNLQ